MIHDIDILRSLVDEDISTLSAVAYDEQHVSAQFVFASGTLANLTASRLTQEKVRRLTITAHPCWVDVDFIDQTIEIHRRSIPEYVAVDGDIQFRYESVVERPTIASGEPLKRQFEGFVSAVRNGTKPLVSATDALQAIELAARIERLALGEADVAEVTNR